MSPVAARTAEPRPAAAAGKATAAPARGAGATRGTARLAPAQPRGGAAGRGTAAPPRARGTARGAVARPARAQPAAGLSGAAARLAAAAFADPGQPVDAGPRADVERHLGHDLADVRVHDGPRVRAAAVALGARAYTVGRSVALPTWPGRPVPDRTGTLRHELVHVVQQSVAAGGPGTAHAAEAQARTWTSSAGRAGVVRRPVGVARAPEDWLVSTPAIQGWSVSRLQTELHALEDWMFLHANEGVDAGRIFEARGLVAAEIRRRTGAPPQPPTTTAGTATATATTSSSSAATEQIRLIQVELDEVVPLATRMVEQATSTPTAVALNAIRGVRTRLRQDIDELNATAALGGAAAASARAAVARLEPLLARVVAAVAAAARWHDEHPAGESLGMWNERQGTALAGAGLRHWEQGGLHYVVAIGAFVASFGVALLDAAEQLASFGFHEAATAVSQAYTRGDISWDEGERILRSAAVRALLVAAITRGAGAATSRLGGLAARGAGLAPEALSSGIVAGGISGGLTATASMGAQALFTRALQERFDSPEGRAIWRQGIPTGRQWAYAIPLSILFGAAAGARAVEAANRQLLGRVIDTPGGPARIVHITRDGRMVLQPVGALRPPPPPPPSATTLVYNEATGTWSAEAPTTAIVPATPPPRTPVTPVQVTPGPLAPVRPPVTPAPIVPAPPPALRAVPGTGGLRPPAPQLPPPTPTPRPSLAPPPTATAPVTTPTPPTTAPTVTPQPSTGVTPPALTPRGQAAAQRVSDTASALASARTASAPARAALARATGDLEAARQLAAEGGADELTRAWIRQAQAQVRAADLALRPLARSEATAATEAAEAIRAQAAIARLEGELTRLNTQIATELNPPGGFTRAQILEGRQRWIPPRAESVQPSGREYHRLVRERNRVSAELESEVRSLHLTRQQQLAAATPGPEARPVALANAGQLDAPLRPVGGVPIDVTTGAPMTTPNWATDHLVSRYRIAQDRRYDLLTPAQRDGILLDVPENYLPMTLEANSSKGARTVAEWIAHRAATGRPIPPPIAAALLRAEARAQAAIEAFFQRALRR